MPQTSERQEFTSEHGKESLLRIELCERVDMFQFL